MLEPIVNFFDKLVDQFTWRRLVLLAVLLAIAASSIWGYEQYTQKFKLARIEKQIFLLEKISSLANNEAIRGNSTLKALQSRIEIQLKETTEVETAEYEIEPWAKNLWLLLLLGLFLVFALHSYRIPTHQPSQPPHPLSVVCWFLHLPSSQQRLGCLQIHG